WAQAPGQRRKIERAETVMGQPSHIRLEECAQVMHAVFEHGDAVYPHTPGKTLIFVRIEAAIPQHVGVDHPAAENFQPVVAFAKTNFTFVALALDVDLKRWLGKRKERRAETHLDVIDLEKCLAEFLQDPFQMAKMRTLVDHKAFNLMEHR